MDKNKILQMLQDCGVRRLSVRTARIWPSKLRMPALPAA